MIRLEDVQVRFPLPARASGPAEHLALDGLTLEVRGGETLCLLGGSGSGKTTSLRLMNRLLEPSAGRVLFDGADVRTQDAVTLRRRMGYVVQSGALFPHRTVRGNVGLLCELSGWPRARVDARVEELLELVRLPAADYAARYPAELSGGQRQRVGVARALALDPEVLLMDEPFGALDPPTRRELQQEFLDLRARAPRTTVLVTHDLDEALRLGDRLALLEAGRLLQVGTPSELLERPADERVRSYLAREGAPLSGAGGGA